MLHHYDNNVRRSIVSSHLHGNCLQLKILAPNQKWVKMTYHLKSQGHPHINRTNGRKGCGTQLERSQTWSPGIQSRFKRDRLTSIYSNTSPTGDGDCEFSGFCYLCKLRAVSNYALITSPLWSKRTALHWHCQVSRTARLHSQTYIKQLALYISTSDARRVRIHPLARPSTCGSSEGAEKRAIIRPVIFFPFQWKQLTVYTNSSDITHDDLIFAFQLTATRLWISHARFKALIHISLFILPRSQRRL